MNDATTILQDQINEIDSKLKELEPLLSDPEMMSLVEAEISTLNEQKQALVASINSLSQSPKNDNTDQFSMDRNNAMVEIRGGAGGEEAKLFAEDLLRMYVRFAQSLKFTVETVDDGVIKIKGKNAYKTFKYESGVHRVQRVPVTESSGRIHTSTASVAVLPEVTPTQVTIREEDLEWKFTRAGGHGGQNVNKVNTAVMMTHKPSGIVVHCRQERSQQQNRALALDMLRSRLWEIEEENRLSQIKSSRRLAVGRAMRAEKIRTYNYPENRLTDHRIPKTWYNLDRIMEGAELSDILDQVSSFFTDSEVSNPITQDIQLTDNQ